jgi:hypothetical protein
VEDRVEELLERVLVGGEGQVWHVRTPPTG